MPTTFPTTVETRSDVPAFGAAGEGNRDDAVNQWMLDAIIALQAKVGADSSGVAGAHDKLIADLQAADVANLLNVQKADVLLSASELNGLRGANIELVAAPAAGTALVLVAAHFLLVHGGTDFVQTNGADALAILYSGSTQIGEVSSEANMTTFLESAATAALFTSSIGDVVPVAATALDLDNNGAADYATGDGALHVRTYYRTVPMAAFAA